MFLPLFAAALSFQPLSADDLQYRSNDVAGALKRGCKVQRIGGPGKVEQPAIIRCPAQQASGSSKPGAHRRGS